MGKSDSLKYGINRATLSGPKSKQHRIRQTAHHFVKVLRQANMGAQKWTKVTNKHFQRVADAMRADGVGDGRIAEVFSAARHICRAYGNDHISNSNAAFGVRRGSIANATSRAVSLEVFQDTLTRMRNDTSYPQAGRAAAQIELMYELGLRREESAKLDLPNDWNRENHSLLISTGPRAAGPGPCTTCPRDRKQRLIGPKNTCPLPTGRASTTSCPSIWVTNGCTAWIMRPENTA